jgi:hypothetical protein
MTPDPDQCLHPADVEMADGSIVCDRCGRVIPPKVERMPGRAAIDFARKFTRRAAELEPVDPKDVA